METSLSYITRPCFKKTQILSLERCISGEEHLAALLEALGSIPRAYIKAHTISNSTGRKSNAFSPASVCTKHTYGYTRHKDVQNTHTH